MDPLSGGSPKRLIQDEGNWILEVHRLIAVDSTVFRPHVQRLEGTEQIAAYFRRNPEVKHLAVGAQRLLQAPATGGARSFEAVGAEWVVAALAPDYLAGLKRTARSEVKRNQLYPLIQLRTELYRLRAECVDLRERVQKLEAQVAQGEGPHSTRHAAGRQPLRANGEQGPAAFVEGERSAGAGPSGPIGPMVSARPPGRAALPGPEALVKALKQVVGHDLSAKTCERVDLTGEGPFYVSALRAEKGEIVAAIVFDLRATVFLGGTLMMTPETDLQAQITAQTPAEDSLEASLEVCHALANAINKVADNPRLQAEQIAPLALDALPWIGEALTRIDLADSLDGRTVVLTR